MKRFLPVLLLFCSLCQFSQGQNYNVSLAGTLPYPGETLANICGYVDSTGREYALCGAANGMTVVDVTVPSSPTQIVQIPYNNIQAGYALWKEIKVYKNYAYITSEAGAGLQIVDLRHLPATTNFPSKYYTGDGTISGLLGRIHALHIDTTKKFVYLYGSTLNNGGAVVLDISSDPWNPTYAGGYSTDYIHDGYVDNDTLYGGHIYGGYFSVIDMTNKTSPQVLATTTTPLAFTHNTWPSADKKTIFTTDEKQYSYLTSYDISNLSNITELDRVRTADTNAIVHNTHIVNNYAVSSWYVEGFTIVDVTYPYNMIEVGKYDTYAGSALTFEGAWGVYPYLPSGTIVVSNIDEGLFVLSPNYVRACYLEGNVKDSVTLADIPNALVEILGTTENDLTNFSGNYATGYATAGTYSVRYSANGYQTRIINNISLSNGVMTMQHVKLWPSGAGVPNVLNPKSFITVNGNPFTDACNLNYYLETGMEQGTLMVHDASGKLIESKELSTNAGQISLGSNYAYGLYFVSIKTTKATSTPVKVVKVN